MNNTYYEFRTFLQKMAANNYVTDQSFIDLSLSSQKFMLDELSKPVKFVISDNNDDYPNDRAKLKIYYSSANNIIEDFIYFDTDRDINEEINLLKTSCQFTNKIHSIVINTDYFE